MKEGYTSIGGCPAKTVNIFSLNNGRLQRAIKEYANETCERHQYSLGKIIMGNDLFKELEKSGWVFQGYYLYVNQYGCNCRTYQPYIQHIPIIIDKDRDNVADRGKVTMVK